MYLYCNIFFHRYFSLLFFLNSKKLCLCVKKILCNFKVLLFLCGLYNEKKFEISTFIYEIFNWFVKRTIFYFKNLR